MDPKFMFIMRGLPGSGRAETAQKIASDDGVVLSSPITGDSLKLLISSCHPKIVIDGDHTKFADIEDYIEAGFDNDYTIVLTYSGEPWAWDVPECARLSGKTEEELNSMLNEFEFEDEKGNT